VGAGPAPAGSRTPTHVVKSSHGGKDWMVVGTYTAGLPRELGTFLPTGKETMIDHGALYASKDMYDPCDMYDPGLDKLRGGSELQ
jgi:hypothetical protein